MNNMHMNEHEYRLTLIIMNHKCLRKDGNTEAEPWANFLEVRKNEGVPDWGKGVLKAEEYLENLEITVAVVLKHVRGWSGNQ